MDAFREPSDEHGITLSAAFGFPVGAFGSRLGISQTLVFRLLQCPLLHKQSLSFVLLSRAAPLEDDGAKHRVCAGAARERGVAGRKKHEVIEVCAGEAECAAIACEEDPCAPSEILTAVVASRLAIRDEYSQIAGRYMG